MPRHESDEKKITAALMRLLELVAVGEAPQLALSLRKLRVPRRALSVTKIPRQPRVWLIHCFTASQLKRSSGFSADGTLTASPCSPTATSSERLPKRVPVRRGKASLLLDNSPDF